MAWKFMTTTLAALAAAVPSIAAEQVLPFKLVVTRVDEAPLEAAPAGLDVHAARYVGVATFEDGRTAFKEFVLISAGGETGEMNGYSTYTFENGDALYLKFVAGWSDEGFKGDYELVSGTGAFEGATGTGHFEAVGDSWDRAELMEGTFTLQMPGT